jgi:hypothetical protein
MAANKDGSLSDTTAGIAFRQQQLDRIDRLIGEESGRSWFVRDGVDVLLQTDDRLKANGMWVAAHELDEWVMEAVEEKIERESD